MRGIVDFYVIGIPRGYQFMGHTSSVLRKVVRSWLMHYPVGGAIGGLLTWGKYLLDGI